MQEEIVAVSFSLLFATEELAHKFVWQVVHGFKSPCLRDQKTVYVVSADANEMRDILAIGRRLGAVDL